MGWLTPLTGLYAAAATVPILLLLYFLKLKRREQLVSSTLLWKRAVQDLQVNAPFQRIRRNILFLLQLLMLSAMLLGLAGPVLAHIAGPAKKYVLLVDRSASMNASDVQPSRLHAAKKQAADFTESLRNRALFSFKDDADQAMVIAFDNRAKLMCSFTSDRRQLVRAIEAIEPGDGGSALAEALVVARAFAQSPGLEAGPALLTRSAEEPAQLILFSDGRIHDTGEIRHFGGLGPDELVFNCVGKTGQNVAITAMQARRSYENPDEIEVFCTLANYGDEEVTCDVQLSLNEDVQAVKSVVIPHVKRAGDSKPDRPAEADQPGRVAVNFSLLHTGAGVLQLRHLHRDNLAVDDAAWAIISPPKKLSVLLVTGGNAVLESALKASEPARLDIRSPAQFDAMDHSALSVEQPWDVIVLDNYAPPRLSKGRYLVFGQCPNNIDVSVGGRLRNQVIVDWRPKHAVLKYVNMANLFAAECCELSLPRDAEVLAEFARTPAIAVVRRAGSVFLLAGFDVLQTNWPFEPGFVLFCCNALNFLGVQTGEQQSNLRAGQPIVVDGLTADTIAQVGGPGLSGESVRATPGGSIRFPATERVGVYGVDIAGQPTRVFAVNLLDSDESNIAPAGSVALSDKPVQARQSGILADWRSNVPLWPFLVGSALVLACLEWLIYNSKVRI